MRDNTKFIVLSLKKFSHSLSDFKDYIYPYQQMSTSLTPELATIKT